MTPASAKCCATMPARNGSRRQRRDRATSAGASSLRALPGMTPRPNRHRPSPERTTSAKGASVKTGKDELEAKAHKADAEETASDAAPLQDDLPLLIAFHDLRHFSTAAKAAGRNAATGESPSEPALDGQAPLPKTYRSKSSAGREALETMSKPEQASIVDGPLTDLDGKFAASPGAASSAPKRDNTGGGPEASGRAGLPTCPACSRSTPRRR
jgi:chemotaxis protein MotD